jgi:hypothetical protein
LRSISFCQPKNQRAHKYCLCCELHINIKCLLQTKPILLFAKGCREWDTSTRKNILRVAPQGDSRSGSRTTQKGPRRRGPRGESLRGSTAPSQFRMSAKPNTCPPVALRLPPGWPGQGWPVSPTHGVSPRDYALLRSIIQFNCFPARLLISIL